VAVSSSLKRVAVLGASGYTGAEMLRLLAGHPGVEVVLATGDSQAGTPIAALYPSLSAHYGDVRFAENDPVACHGLDAVFLGLPHEASLQMVPQLVGQVGCVVDLSAAYRLKNAASYPRYYGFDHDQPALLAEAVYGLPERHRSALVGARLIATPGCYVTAATMALAPLVDAGLIETSGVIVDAASGVSGAGRAPKHSNHFCTVDEDMSAYGLVDHRHTPEMEEQIGATLLFTPHLVPMNRGILATCYARPVGKQSTEALLDALDHAYRGEPFVVVRPDSPSTKATFGSNAVHMTARFDERTGNVIVISALDNLCKGASGGAVQAMNVALGLPETAGLSTIGVYP
jgi:N-acetyl-gamma-glutamyl-phosphate reductase